MEAAEAVVEAEAGVESCEHSSAEEFHSSSEQDIKVNNGSTVVSLTN